MELRQVRYFLAAAERLNFTAAAEASHISQSTLSQQLKQLEDELGVLLFHRLGKRVQLTEAGTQLLPFARQMVASAAAGRQHLRNLTKLQTGTLHLGVTYGLRPVLRPALIRFAQAHPGVRITVQLGTSAELLAQLTSLHLDVVLSFWEPGQVPFAYQPLLASPLTLVAATSSPLAGRPSLTLAEVQALPLALPAGGYSTRQFLDAAFAAQRLQANVQLELNDISILLDLVRTGLWHTVLVQATVQDEPGLCAIPLAGADMLRHAGVFWLDTPYRKKAAEVFCELLK